MNKILWLTLLILLIVGCKAPSQYEKIEAFFKEKNINSLKGYRTLIVINENGNCINCNFAFSNGIAKYVDRQDVLFLIASAGN